MDSSFQESQARISSIVHWGQEVVALGDFTHRLHLDAGRSERVTVTGLDQVFSVAGDSVRFAAGLSRGTPRLRRETCGQWEDVPLPAELATASGFKLGASGENLAILGGAKAAPLFWWLDENKWIAIALPSWLTGPAQHLAYRGEHWILGYNRGEFGGALLAVAQDGSVTQLNPHNRSPVTGLAMARDGRLFASTGLAHLGHVETQVGVFDPAWKWTPLAAVGSTTPASGFWNLEPDSIRGLSLDEDDQLYLLTDSLGVLQLAARELRAIVPSYAVGDSILVDRDRVLMGSYNRGVLMWNLSTAEAARISIPR